MAGINCKGNATNILKGVNTVKGFYENYPGIHVPQGKTLTIKGNGSLNASSNGYAAGIGGGTYTIQEGNISCGNIIIDGGTIIAKGGNYAAGIGASIYAACGNITITDGVKSVTAIKGNNGYSPHSIGAGYSGKCGTVTIGGRVYADGISQSPYTYKP